uniref:Uncharacterized protein n=1 Tax=Anguilla anguilla TaxID=7936 RepID=A0A0E9UP20_ANGAN
MVWNSKVFNLRRSCCGRLLCCCSDSVTQTDKRTGVRTPSIRLPALGLSCFSNLNRKIF